MDFTNQALKRQCYNELQLLTPHPSSSTQHAPSSPISTLRRVLPSIQYARPNINGDWFSIGRSSTNNDLALPSNNRLISRVHAKLRYLADQHAFEVQCLGFNGISLQISDQTMYVRRSTGIMVQVNSEDCELGLDVAGSLVVIEIPKEQDIRMEHCAVPIPSSPIVCASRPSYVDEEDVDAELVPQSIEQISALSPLTSSACMLTPSATPKTKRIKLIVHPDSSPLRRNPMLSSSPTSREMSSAIGALQPRLLNFSQSFTSELAADKDSADKATVCTGKENIPPRSETDYMQVSSPSISLDSHGIAQQDSHFMESSAGLFVLTDTDVVHDIGHCDSATANTIEESLLHRNNRSADEAEKDHHDEIVEEEQELGPDPEFVDMILMTMATSPISPAPIASFVPFFPPHTSLDRIEEFLRAQPAVSEVKRSGKDAAGRALRSTWFYEPANDSDNLRRVRLASLQKPIRATKKSHVQYFWKPVHLKTAVPANGLIEQKSKKRGRSKKLCR